MTYHVMWKREGDMRHPGDWEEASGDHTATLRAAELLAINMSLSGQVVVMVLHDSQWLGTWVRGCGGRSGTSPRG